MYILKYKKLNNENFDFFLSKSKYLNPKYRNTRTGSISLYQNTRKSVQTRIGIRTPTPNCFGVSSCGEESS